MLKLSLTLCTFSITSSVASLFLTLSYISLGSEYYTLRSLLQFKPQSIKVRKKVNTKELNRVLSTKCLTYIY